MTAVTSIRMGRLDRLRVVGVVRGPADLLPPRTSQFALYSDEPDMLLPPAWYRANGPDVGSYGIVMVADLEPGVTLEDLSVAVADRFGERAFVFPAEDEVGIPTDVRRAVDRQIGSEGRAVLVFALAVAIVATLLFALAMSRQLAAEGADRRLLRSLGVRRSELRAGRSDPVVGGGGRRRRRRRRGVDRPVSLATDRCGWANGARSRGGRRRPRCCSSGASSSRPWWSRWCCWRGGARRRTVEPGRRRPSRIGSPGSVRLRRRPSACTWPSIGHRPRWPAVARSRVGGLAIAVTIAAAAVLASFDELQGTPDRIGQVWDASAGNFASAEGQAAGLAEVDEMEGIDAVAGELGVTATIGGQDTNAVAYLPFVGELVPNLREGRPPRAVDEVVLGAKLADELDAEVGDRLPVAWDTLDGAPEEVTVTGIGAVAGMGFEVDPGQSALVSPEVAELDPDNSVSVLLVRFADDADREALRGGAPRAVPADGPRRAGPIPIRADAGRAARAPGGARGRRGAAGAGGGRQRGARVRAPSPARAGGRQGPRAAASRGPAGGDVAGRGVGGRRGAGRACRWA